MPEAVIVHDLGKRFRNYHTQRPTSFKDLFINGPRWLRPKEYLWALRNVSFSVPNGRMVGIVGRNGSGKSTLLNLIGDLLRPDEGYIKTSGRIGALLSLGAGFHPDLSGRENVFVNGIITGLTRREVKQRLDSIIEFAELESFIDSPLRTYSSGMRMRLAFAIAVHIHPEILLIDEVLAVGDLAFQRKCFDRIEQFKSDGCAIILVSHELGKIEKLCDEVLWLRGGQQVAHGDPAEVVNSYVAAMEERTQQRTPSEAPVAHTSTNAELCINENRFGSQEIQIAKVQFLSSAGLSVVEINSGDALHIEIDYSAPTPINAPIFGIAIKRQEDREACCTINTAAAGLSLPTLCGQGKIILHLGRLDLTDGQYFVNVGVYERNWEYTYDYHSNVYPLFVRSDGARKGILHPPYDWDLQINGAKPLGFTTEST